MNKETISRVSDTYNHLVDALSAYVTAEKEATRERYEEEEAPAPEPLVVNVAGELYEVDELDEEQESPRVPRETLGIHNPEYNVTLMMAGDIRDLDDAACLTMMAQLMNAFMRIEG